MTKSRSQRQHFQIVFHCEALGGHELGDITHLNKEPSRSQAQRPDLSSQPWGGPGRRTAQPQQLRPRLKIRHEQGRGTAQWGPCHICHTHHTRTAHGPDLAAQSGPLPQQPGEAQQLGHGEGCPGPAPHRALTRGRRRARARAWRWPHTSSGQSCLPGRARSFSHGTRRPRVSAASPAEQPPRRAGQSHRGAAASPRPQAEVAGCRVSGPLWGCGCREGLAACLRPGRGQASCTPSRTAGVEGECDQ